MMLIQGSLSSARQLPNNPKLAPEGCLKPSEGYASSAKMIVLKGLNFRISALMPSSTPSDG
jgi:hypothetical protein